MRRKPRGGGKDAPSTDATATCVVAAELRNAKQQLQDEGARRSSCQVGARVESVTAEHSPTRLKGNSYLL